MLRKKTVAVILTGLWGVFLLASPLSASDKWGTHEMEALKALKLKGNVEAGFDLYDDVCINCHQEGGNGDPSGAFPQLAGQHSTVIIKQLADIRAKNRDNPTMYPFASAAALTDSPAEGAQALADVAAYIETLKMLKDNVKGPGGALFILKNEYEIAPHKALERLEKSLPKPVFKKLNQLKNKPFKTKKSFLKAVSKAIGKSNTKKHLKVILRTADWSSDLKLGKKLFKENCVRCHGDHGQGKYKDYYPVIAGQNYFYLMRQFSWIKGGKRRNANPDMVKQIADFNDLDLRSVLDVASRFRMKKGDWKK